MKNKFQSKSVPRGTRTLWRYLSAFILLFSLSIGQMWAADVTWDFSNRSATSFSNGKSYQLFATDGTTEMRYSAGSSDAIVAKDGNKSGYLKENGTTGSATVKDIDETTNVGKTRLIRLFVSGKGKLTINCNGTNGKYKVLDGATNGTTLVSSLDANTQSSELTVANFLWIETSTKGYITSIVWAPSSSGGGNVAPSISAPTADSESAYLLNAEASELSITASGTPTPSYQWYYKASKTAEDSTEVGSATSATYSPVTTSAYDRYYYCKVSNSEGVKISKFFRVQVLAEAIVPTITFNNGSYIIEDLDLDLSSLFTSNSAGAVTYSITDAGTTGALLRADGKSLYATTAGTATVQASQTANGIYAAKAVTATVSVAADENLLLKVRLSGSAGATKSLSGSKKTGATAAVQQLGSGSPYKLSNDFKSYVALTLPSGEYFHAGDSVVFDLSKAGEVYCGTLPAGDASEFPEGSALLGTTTKSGSIYYYVLPNTLPANTSTIYTSRSSSTYNGTLTYMAVYRIPTCQDPATALSLSSDAAATVYAGDVITFSTTGGNGGTVTIEGGDSETITDSKWTATEGEHTFTASQAKNGDYCAQEYELELTVLAATPVTEVTVAGASAAYKGDKVIFTATAEYAAQYEWYVDGTKQGSDSAKLHFTPSTSKTYSIVCKAKNSFNSDWIASTPKSLEVTSLYGELIRYVVDGGTAAKEKTGALVDIATPEVSLSSGTTQDLDVDEVTYTGYKMDKGKYVGVKLTSGSFAIGDTVSFLITKTTGTYKLYLYDTKEGSKRLDSIAGAGVTGWASFVLNQATTGVYLYRSNPDVKPYDQNPYVAAVRVVRPMPVKETAYDLTAVKINGTAISAANLATLKTADYLLDLSTEYAAAPTVKFAKQITKTYEDDSQKVTTDTITVIAAVESGEWQAQATIGTITYTVKMAKVSAAKVYYYDGATKLGEETVVIDGSPIEYAAKQSKQLATFKGWYANSGLTGDAVTIAEAVITKDTTFYGKWEYTYTSSFNIEQWVLTNGAGKGSATQTAALMSALGSANYLSNIEWSNTSGKEIELDELNNAKNDSLRNYSYLGLKVKNSGKLLNFRVAPSSVVKVKFGELKMTPKVSINGGDYAAMTISSGVYTYTATGEDLISIYIDVAEKAVVFKQIMIDADLVNVMPAVTYGETTHGTISGLKLGIPGETFKVYPKADAGYMVTSVTVNGEAITPSEGVYSFTMPNTAVAVAATFAVPSFTVTYNANNGGSDPAIVDYDAALIAANFFTYEDHIFLGWNTEEDGSGDAYAVGATVTSNLNLYAQWLEFTGCYYFGAKSVTSDESITAPAYLDVVYGGKMQATTGTFKYTTAGVLIDGGSDKYFTVTLDYALQEGSKIYVKIYAGNTSARGLYLRAAGSSTNLHSFSWTPSATEPAQMLFEEEYEVPANSPLIGKKVFYLYRYNNVYLQTVTVKNCAPQDYTVTYMDGAKTLGTEMVFENAHPTASEIYAKKQSYTFLGWKESAEGAVVNLEDIVITADKTLYAAYEAATCPANGVMFSLEMDELKVPTSNVYYPNVAPAVGDMDVYAAVSGGIAQAVNATTNKKIEIHTDAQMKLAGSDSHLRILLDCPLAANDTIKFAKDQVLTISFDSLKTKKVDLAKAESFYIVPAAYAGLDSLHLWYNGSGVQLSKVEVIRPEIYTVSFNKLGHGSDVADITGVIKGSKITAPTAPTDEDYAFAGWYKENTLSNAWDFDNDVVVANTTLYAKWTDMSDATLKSLMYGDEEIALVEDKYEYNVEVPSFTTVVPALTAETSNPNASALVADAAAFDETGKASSTVTVTPEKAGAAQKVYTVIFMKASALPQVDVTATTEWDFTGGNAAASKINLNYVDIVLANVAGVKTENINAQALLVNANYISNAQLQAKTIMFKTTVPGELTIRYSCTSNKGEGNERTLYINDQATISATYNDVVEYKQVVPAGEVTIKAMYDKSGTPTVDIMNYKYIEFKTLDELTPDYTRPVTVGRIGTICVDHNVPAGCFIGAEVYKLLYWKYGTSYADCQMVDFEQVDEMVAGNPYLIIPTEEMFKLYYGAVVDATPNEVNHFIGTYDAIEQGPEGDAILEGKYGIVNNQIRLLGAGAYSPANRAFIDLENLQSKEEYEAAQTPNPAPKRRISLSRQGTAVATGLDAINVDTEKVQKVMIDGQMYIIRNGHVFTVSGNLVK